jgi:hypothetical protein
MKHYWGLAPALFVLMNGDVQPDSSASGGVAGFSLMEYYSCELMNHVHFKIGDWRTGKTNAVIFSKRQIEVRIRSDRKLVTTVLVKNTGIVVLTADAEDQANWERYLNELENNFLSLPKKLTVSDWMWERPGFLEFTVKNDRGQYLGKTRVRWKDLEIDVDETLLDKAVRVNNLRHQDDSFYNSGISAQSATLFVKDRENKQYWQDLIKRIKKDEEECIRPRRLAPFK